LSYRVKLHNGRAVGPFSKEEIGQLMLKGHIDGQEKYQVFPNGKWLDLKNYGELKTFLVKILEQKPGVKIKGEKTAEIRDESLTQFKEFKFQIENEETPKNFEATKNVSHEGSSSKRVDDDTDEDEPPSLDKTVVRNRVDFGSLDKTRILKINQVIEEPKQKEILPEIPVKEETRLTDLISDERGTEVVNYKQALKSLKEEARVEELKMVTTTNGPQAEEEKHEQSLTTTKTLVQKIAKSKKMKPVVALAFVTIIFFLLFEEEEKPKFLPPILPVIEFPIVSEYEDANKAAVFLEKGIIEYNKGKYFNKVSAAMLFKESLVYKFKGNDALGRVILAYAEILPSSATKTESLKTIHKLIELAKDKSLQDIVLVEGITKFYLNAGKPKTALRFLERFLRVSQPTTKILSLYLDLLVETGDLARGRDAYEKLVTIKSIPLEGVLSIAEFLEVNEQYKESEEFLVKFKDKFQTHTAYQLKWCSMLIRRGEYKLLKEVLKVIGQNSAERSLRYIAQYFEYLGVMNAIEGKNKDAAEFFKKSLDFAPSPELQSKLATLELGGEKEVRSLLLESKINDLIRQSRLASKQLKWDRAFILAIEAVDLAPLNIRSQLWLAELQSLRGYYVSALETLENLRKNYLDNSKVNSILVKTYIESYRLDKAKEVIAQLSTTKFESTPDYASMLGRYYLKMGNVAQAVVFLRESLRRDPLNEEDYFALAKIYMDRREYVEAKVHLLQAMDLSPDNIEYFALYAKILYERDGVETAVGYLLKKLIDFPDDPKLLGDIAIYYYQSGQEKYYQNYKEKLENSPYKDRAFYEFIIENAKRENNVDEVIKYSKDLLLNNPGDLDARLSFAKYLFENGKDEESLNQFQEVKLRLKTLPRVNYYLAKLYLKKLEVDKALALSDEEVKYNPNIYFGYHVRGMSYYAKQDYAKAIENLEAAISRNHRSQETLKLLGEIKFAQNDLERARDLYLRALNENKTDPETYKQLGYIFQASGQRQLAVEYFQDYLKILVDAPDREKVQSLIKSMSN
jgi:tetratricopeptide (TPR) repeat protein